MEEKLKKDMEGSKRSSLNCRKYLRQSSVAFKNRCVETLQLPKVYTINEIAKFREIVQTTYGIFEKVIGEYLKNEEYRKEFPFSKELEELICTPVGYKGSIPITRIDIFFNEEDFSFKFCEFNTDGTSAMVEDLELRKALEYNNIFGEISKEFRLDSFELFDSWVREVEAIYQTYNKRVQNPHIAIVDFLDKAYLPEFTEFEARFKKYGFTVEVCDIRKMEYKQGKLISKETGKKIDLIYRRAVTCDIMEQKSEIQPFLQAVKGQDVCLLGGFKTQIVHHKALFYVLHGQKTKEILTKEEKKFVEEHVPKTYLLDEYDTLDVCRNKEKWILKPIDSYASRGVYAGIDYTKEEWKDLVDKSTGKSYIVQEYCIPFKTLNIDLTLKNPILKEYNNLTGIYVYGGRFAGVYSRMADGGIISSQYNEKTVATLFVQEK